MKSLIKNVLLTGLLLILTACSRSPHDKLLEALETIQSWTATAQMVGEAWQQGNVPDQYARQTLIKSQQEISKAMKGLSAPPASFQKLQQAIQKMTVNVEQHNKTAITTSLRIISIEQQQLDALAEAAGAEQ